VLSVAFFFLLIVQFLLLLLLSFSSPFLFFSALFLACLDSAAAAVSEDIVYLHCYCALFYFYVRRSPLFVQFEQFCYLQKNNLSLYRARGFSLASRCRNLLFCSTLFFP